MVNELGSDLAVHRCFEFYVKLGGTALLFALLVACCFFFRGRKLRLPPGPFPLPIIGNLLWLLGELPHQALATLSVKYGPFMSLHLGSALTLVVSSADLAKEILKTHDHVFANRPPIAATRMALGRKYSDQDLTGSRGIISLIQESVLLLGSFNVGDYIPWLDWMDLQGFNHRFKNLHKLQDELLEKILEELVLQSNPTVVPDLVDVFLAASMDETTGFQITRDNIKAVIYDMLLAGIDTSSTGIEWAMSEVLGNPPVLKKLQDELESVVGLDRMVRESDLPSLVYLQAVVKETLRLHPPGPLSLPHFSVEDCTVLGYEIPRGTCVLINLWAIGRNPKSWGEDAENFKPERFMEAGFLDAKVQNLEWIPFGVGRRGCPGQQLGTILVEFAVAQLVHCFSWSLPNEINGQDLDMTEAFNGLTVSRKHELLAVPTPRLPIL